MAGVKNFWGREKGIVRAWLGPNPYIYLTEAKKVEVSEILSYNELDRSYSSILQIK